MIDPDPPEPKSLGEWGQVYQTTAVQPGQLTYGWVFEIQRGSHTYGFYKWDPQIKVTLIE